MNIYQQQILDHYNHPQHSGKLENFTHTARVDNVTCGDAVSFYLDVVDGVVKDVGYEAEGCAISIAAASLLSEDLLGKPISDLSGLNIRHMLDLLGIELTTARLKCAHLPLQAVQRAVE